MTAHTNSAHAGNKYVATTLALSMLVLSVAVAAAFWLGLFSGESQVDAQERAIAVSSNRLDFGTIPVNGSVVRQLVLRNDGPEPVRAQIEVDGTIYRVSPDNLILHPGVSSRVSVVAEAHQPGNLDNELHILVDDEASPLVISLDGEATNGLTEEPSGTRALRVSNDDPPAGDDAQVVAVPRGVRPEARRSSRPAPDPVRVADASTATADPRPSAAAATSSPRSTSQTPARSARNGDADADDRADRSAEDRSGRTASMRVIPYDPATAPPFRGISDTTVPIDDPITEDQAAEAGKLPSTIPDEDPAELEDDDDLFDDIFDDDDGDKDPNEEPDPFDTPALKISGLSTVRLLGSTATFYPQNLPVIGSGATWALADAVQFPQVPLAFGESMVFAQAGAVSGGYDPMTGSVSLQLPVQAVDSDGDAAPLVLRLTTGTALARNESGIVVSLNGAPRADSGVVRLVGIEKIPSGFRNGAEEHLVIVEILASLNFEPSITAPRPTNGFGRLGG